MAPRFVVLLFPVLLFAQEAKMELPSATFTAPEGWSARTTPSAVHFTAPEKDLTAVIVEVTAPDAAAAVAQAWKAAGIVMERTVRLRNTAPGRQGWEHSEHFLYETSPNEKRFVSANASRAAGKWAVSLVEGSEATLEKRNAQLSKSFGSLRPKGYQRETFAGRKPLSLTPERVEQMKSFVTESMQQLGIPGASMALIEGGKVIFAGGFGVKELGKPDKVDENTLFMAASNTKGMATLLLSVLADEGKLRWNQPVVEIYPKFRLGDPEVTKQVEMRHLVCACTGLPRQDLEWLLESQKSTPASSMALLATMKPTSRFGEVFQYSNLMASAAGYIGGALYAPGKELGAAFDEAMQKKIFDPLGMSSTTFDMAKAQRGNHARPHSDTIDFVPALAQMGFNYAIVPHRPAGGVWTSARDLARYVQLELNRGLTPEGKRIVSEQNLLARRHPQVATGEDSSYGMGLSVAKRNGVTVISHGGSLLGFKSDWAALPDHGVGAVLLTNADKGGALLGPFRRRLLEVLFDGKPEARENVAAAANNMRENRASERKRLTVPPDPAAAAKLSPAYQSPELGPLAVKRKQDETWFDVGEWKSRVATRKNDDGTVSFLTIDPGLIGFEFVPAAKSGKQALVIRDAQHEYVFAPVK